MKLLLCFLLTGCASTTIYNQDGSPLLRTQADIVGLEMGDIRIARLDHSTPTKAGVGGITAAGSAVAATGLATLLK